MWPLASIGGGGGGGGGIVTNSCLTLVTPWTVACQAPLPMAVSGQEYGIGLPFPSPGDLPNRGIEPRSAALRAGFLPAELWGKPLAHIAVFQMKVLNSFRNKESRLSRGKTKSGETSKVWRGCRPALWQDCETSKKGDLEGPQACSLTGLWDFKEGRSEGAAGLLADRTVRLQRREIWFSGQWADPEWFSLCVF